MVNKIDVFHTAKQRLLANKVASLYKAGISITKIAEDVDITRPTIYVWLKGLGLMHSKESTVTEQTKGQPSSRKTGKVDQQRVVAKVIKQLGKTDRSENFTGKTGEDDESPLVRSLKKEVRRLNKALIEETIKSASLESAMEDQAGHKTEENSEKDLKVLKQQNKQLRSQLKHEHMRAEAYDTMIDIAEEQLGVDIRKKPDAK